MSTFQPPRWRASGRIRAIVLCLTLGACATDQGALSSSPGRGAFLARRACAECHSIDGRTPSPVKDAPRFSDLAALHPDRTLDEIVARGLILPHRPMPAFSAGSQDISDLAAYVRGIH